MLTRQSIIESHEVNFAYGYARRGELDHQESAFVGPMDIVDDDVGLAFSPEAGTSSSTVVTVSVGLGVTSTGMRVINIE